MIVEQRYFKMQEFKMSAMQQHVRMNLKFEMSIMQQHFRMDEKFERWIKQYEFEGEIKQHEYEMPDEYKSDGSAFDRVCSSTGSNSTRGAMISTA